MTYIKETSKGRLEKYIKGNSVITFMSNRNKTFITRKKIKQELGCNNKYEYINQLIASGFVLKARV